MAFVSTSGDDRTYDLEETVFRGLAPDGGLFVLPRVPRLADQKTQSLVGTPWPEVAEETLALLLKGCLEKGVVRGLTRAALDFPVPLVQLRDDLFVLELFRGPTLAFKDVGARFLARLITHFRQPADPPTTILTATSGDTGGAVAQAFHELPGTRVVVLFPEGKVSPRQERQFSTLGGNITAVAVQGDFDDCQRMAKEAFQRNSDPSRNPSWDYPGLTSANSINVGRFLPQTTYYVYVWSQLSRQMKKGDINRNRILISVPSGNFGNLAAGLLARAMGLENLDFLAATNRNDAVPRYLETGVYSPVPSLRTLSTAMDVGDPSNLDRILYLYRNDLAALKRDVAARVISDQETIRCLSRVHRETGYILDPHSAVGFAALEEELRQRPGSIGVLLATAHPAKFAEVVEPALGSSLPLPLELERRLKADRQVHSVPPRTDALREILFP